MRRTVAALGLLAAALSTPACSTADDGPSGIDVTALDRAADPCTDFYQFACGGHIATHPVGGDGAVATKFFEPYYAAVPLLMKIIVADADGAQAADDPHASLIGAFYASCIDAPTDTSSRDELRALLQKIDAVATLDDLARQVADQRAIGSGSFFRLGVWTDPGNATRYAVTIDQGGVELADRSYYLDADQEDVRAAYRAHIVAMSTLIGGTPIDADAAIRVETALATASLPGDARRNPEELYHPMKVADAAALAPTFPWQVFLAQAGYADLTEVNVVVPDYLVALEALFQHTPIEDLKSYLRWQLLQDHAAGLDQAFIDEDFRFWSTFTGASEQSERWFTCFNATLDALGDAVAEPYVARYADGRATAATSAMFGRAQGAFAARLRKATWLDASTRAAALEKLDAIVPKIGHPADGPDLAGLALVPGSYLDNRVAIRRFAWARMRARLGQPVDREAWNLSAVTVNATYGPTANDVTLPAVLLASPFLSADRTEAANFGALGAVIGHEMTHGFDDKGRHYGHDGTLRDWWSKGAEQGFAERTQCLVDQFDAYEPLPGEHVNGKLTLGENTADLGGVSIAYDAMFDGSGEETGGDGFTAEQVFFIAYAQIFCENVRPDLQSQWLLTDPHSPGKLRINGPLSNLAAFRDAFSCPDEGPMTRKEPCAVW